MPVDACFSTLPCSITHRESARLSTPCHQVSSKPNTPRLVRCEPPPRSPEVVAYRTMVASLCQALSLHGIPPAGVNATRFSGAQRVAEAELGEAAEVAIDGPKFVDAADDAARCNPSVVDHAAGGDARQSKFVQGIEAGV